MDPTAITKVVVCHMSSFIVGGVIGNIIKNFRPRFQNRALDLLADASGFVAGWVVSSMVQDHLRRAAVNQVDDTAKKIRTLYQKITQTV